MSRRSSDDDRTDGLMEWYSMRLKLSKMRWNLKSRLKTFDSVFTSERGETLFYERHTRRK